MPSSISNSETRPARIAAWPVALAASVAAFFICERLVWNWRPLMEVFARSSGPGEKLDPLRVAARTALLPAGGPPPVVVIGSSQLREGVDRRMVETSLPGRACANLSISGGTPLDWMFILRRVDARSPRRIVVTQLAYPSLDARPKTAFVDTATLGCLIASGSLASLSRHDALDLASGLINAASDTLRTKSQLRVFFDQLPGTWTEAWRLETPPASEFDSEGKPPRPREYFEDPKYAAAFEAQAVPGRFAEAQLSALRLIVAGELRRKNPVVIVDFPMRPGSHRRLPADGAAYIERQRAEFQGRTGVTLLLERDLPAFQEQDYFDFTHLTATGRAKLTKRLIQVIDTVAAQNWK